MDYELTAEQRELRAVVHDFVAAELRPRARHTDETGEFNWPAVRKMGPLGLLGLEVPEEYGGAALDAGQVVDGDDGAVPELPQQAGLVADAPDDLGRLRPLLLEQLHGRQPAEAVGVGHAAQPHRPEAPGGDLAEEVESAGGLAAGQWGLRTRSGG